jgi:hypothetical protein
MPVRGLTVDNVVDYLIDRQLINAADIVDGDLEVIDVGRRNQNLMVTRKNGPSYLIKQAGAGEPGTDLTVRSEAAFYSDCQSNPDAEEVRRIVPALQDWDRESNTLALELVSGRSLWAHYASLPASEFASDVGGPLGHALGTLHRTFRHRLSLGPEQWMRELPSTPPWILFALRPTPEMLAHLSPANLEVLKLLHHNPEIAASLDALRRDWTADTLIHNDLKGDNVLVIRSSGNGPSVRIIDWELIQIGDAAWDVGCLLRDFLDYWLLTVPLSRDLSAHEMVQAAELPLSKLHPVIRAFWQAYRLAAGVDPGASGQLLTRSLRFAAARIAQAAYELATSAQVPSNLAVARLQLAANMTTDPGGASLHLLGIPVPWRPEGVGT